MTVFFGIVFLLFVAWIWYLVVRERKKRLARLDHWMEEAKSQPKLLPPFRIKTPLRKLNFANGAKPSSATSEKLAISSGWSIPEFGVEGFGQWTVMVEHGNPGIKNDINFFFKCDLEGAQKLAKELGGCLFAIHLQSLTWRQEKREGSTGKIIGHEMIDGAQEHPGYPVYETYTYTVTLPLSPPNVEFLKLVIESDLEVGQKLGCYIVLDDDGNHSLVENLNTGKNKFGHNWQPGDYWYKDGDEKKRFYAFEATHERIY